MAAVPLLALAAVLVRQEWGGPANWLWLLVEHLASFTLLAMLSALVATAAFRRRLETLPVKLALLWTSSFAWLPQLWNSATPIMRTPKAASGLRFGLSTDTSVSLIALLMALTYVRLGHIFPGAVLALSASTLVASPYVDRALRRAALWQGEK